MSDTKTTIKNYYRLAKPGIVYGNLFTAAGGFLYGAILRIDWLTFFVAMLGTALLMASGCVLNNYFDRDIDAVMKRTKKRALVQGTITTRSAIIFAAALGLVGLLLLGIFVNILTAMLGIIALVSYSFIYTYAKRKTVHATLMGTIPGALPPVAGYTAATGQLDASAWLLFTILVCWQMAHFYAIAIFRLKDYTAAEIPVLPAKHGILITKIQMIVYASLFLLAIVALAKFSYAGLFFLAVMLPLALWWLLITTLGLYTKEHSAWARKVFGISLILLPTFCIALAINAYVP